ncbi:class I SAM-dependent methyltransferase [Shewanella salipaludis]|nr:methyltransferase domain-containing protein [Shewanella salipaludis]
MRIFSKMLPGILLGLGLHQAAAADAPTPSNPDAIAAAVDAGQRLTRDKLRDADRHPQQVLQFLEIAPGQRVLDLFSGGGYYSELLARVVGERGKVVAHNNQAYLPFAKAELAEREYATRLPNVELLLSEANDLTLAAASFDRIFFVLGFHDMYYHEADWPEIDRVKLLRALYLSLKPGGYLAIIDHDALPGADVSSAHEYHRLAKQEVITLMTQMGFELLASSELLKNPEDPLNISVFDPSIKGKSSRYLLKFTRN